MTAPTPGAPDVAELRRLLAAATPGPIQLDPFDGYLVRGDALWPDAREYVFMDHEGQGVSWVPGDAELIAAAVNALPALLDRLDALEAVVGAVRATRSLYEHADGTPRLAIMETPEGDQLARDRDAAKLVSRAALDRLPR